MKQVLVLFFLALSLAVQATVKPARRLTQMLQAVLDVEQVHPDSVHRYIQRIEAYKTTVATPQERMMTALVLGKLYNQRAWQLRYAGYEDYAQRSHDNFRQALAQPEVLASMKVKDWYPLLTRSLGDPVATDVLFVAWNTVRDVLGYDVADTLQGIPSMEWMIHHYEQQDNRRAAFTLVFDSLMQSPTPSLQLERELHKVAERYSGVPDVARVYSQLSYCEGLTDDQRKAYVVEGLTRYPKYKGRKALQDRLLSLTDPSFRWSGRTLLYPDKTYQWIFRVRNMESVDWEGVNYSLNYGESDATWTDDTVQWQSPLALGKHQLWFLPHPRIKMKKNSVKRLEQEVMVSRLQMLSQSLPDGMLRLVVVDRETGEPQRGVSIELYHSKDDTLAYARRLTDAMGSVELSVRKEHNRYQPVFVRLWTNAERDHEIMRLSYGTPWYSPAMGVKRHTEFYTDRSIYRPGQEVKVGGIAYEQEGWQTNVKANDSIKITLVDSEGDNVETKNVCTDAFGVFEVSFVLPANRRSGLWEFEVDNRTICSVHVEQYKCPTFTVELPDSIMRLPRQLLICGTAKRFDGVPLRNARVVAQSTMSNLWRYYNQPTTERCDTLSTDNEGCFVLVLPDDTTKARLHVHVDALSSYGEQQEAQRSYMLRPNIRLSEPVDSTFIVELARDTFDVEHPTELTLSTTRPEAWVYLTFSAAGRMCKDTLLHIRRGTHAIPIIYKEEYGNELTLNVATTLGEQVYTNRKSICLRRPDRQLRLHWDSFRDLSQPGAHEQWKLTLTQPDGTPAEANVLATVYDASLDRIRRHSFDIGPYLNYNQFWLPFYQEDMPYYAGQLWEEYRQKRKQKTHYLCYPAMLDDQWFTANPYQTLRSSGSPRRIYKNTRVVEATMAMAASSAEMSDNAMRLRGTGKLQEMVITQGPSIDENSVLSLRENFQETAYFNARVRTDAKGQAVMEFTLPQSTATWRLRAVAHTKELMHTMFSRELVAQKPVMAQARLPRFLRAGDEATLRGSLTNTTDKSQAVKAMMQVLDATTRKVLLTEQINLALQAQADTTLSFIYKVGEQDVLVRWSVEGKDGTDGEQHRLGVLPTTEQVINTLPITVPKAGAYTYDLKGLYPEDATHRELIVEYTSHPEQLALQALPALAKQRYSDALCVTSALYAQVLAKHLGVETEDSIKVLQHRLKDMQRPDGGISWYPGMPSTRYVTTEVGFQLARLQMLTGKTQDADLLQGILRYLLNEKRNVRDMRGDDMIRVLYTVQATDVKLLRSEQAKVDSLLKMVKNMKPADLTLEGQGIVAVILHRQGLHRKAEAMVNAFRPRLVNSPSKGVYIEHPQGPWRSIDRKLDIHVQLMEALQTVIPTDTLLGGMRQHLLLQKRTQLWDTPIRSVNAIFALMNGYKRQPQVARDLLQLSQQGKHTPMNIIAKADTLGYVRDSVDATQLPTILRLQKFSEGQSWGAAYATFRQPYIQVSSDTTGLAVRQDVPTDVKAGSRITLTQRIMADADYEYVTVVVPRPAALEPIHQLSGIRWQDGLCYYLEVLDSELRYHILAIPRGHYRLRQDYYVERPGQYHTGVSRIQCTLAPEYQGRDADRVMVVE